MSEVVAARKRYEQAQIDARKIVEDARLELGRAIRAARKQDVQQGDIADALSLTREQVRRFQDEADRADGLKAKRAADA